MQLGHSPHWLKKAFSLIIASSTIVMGVGLVAPVAAHAATNTVCTFSGAATPNPPIQPVGGNGNFGFTGPITCVFPNGDSYQGNITVGATAGTYQNTVCGTGSAQGTATITGNVSSSSFTFTIKFVAGEGTGTGSGNIADNDGDTASGGWTLAVNIVPTGGNCATGVTAFTVNGTATN